MICKTVFIYGLREEGTNNVRYIGKTNNIKTRLSDHKSPPKKENSYKSKWVKSVLNKGKKIEIFIIDEVNNEEWKFWEKYWISQFKTWGFKLTNGTEGGDGLNGGKPAINRREILQYNLNGDFLKLWPSILSAVESTKITSILDNCRKKTKTAGGFIWKYNEEGFKNKIQSGKSVKRKLKQISLNGETIKIWNSIIEAQKTLNIQHISEACNNKKRYKTLGGFYWRYIEDDVNDFSKPLTNPQPKKILQISKDGKIIKVWNSISEAEKKLKINHINDALKIKHRLSGGFYWRYESEKNDFKIEKNILSNKILQISKNKEIIKIWNSADEVEKFYDLSNTIRAICKDLHGYKTIKGFYWRYEKDKLIYTIGVKPNKK